MAIKSPPKFPGLGAVVSRFAASFACVAISIFAALPSAPAQTYSQIKTFAGPPSEGSHPRTIVEGSDGVLYGITQQGGANNTGTIYRLNKDGSGFAVLKSFDNTNDAQGANSLIQGADGSLYGTTNSGDSHGGTLYKISKDGSGFAVLRTFTIGNEQDPDALIQASDQRLYGTTLYNVYAVNTDGSGYTVLRTFSPEDGTLIGPLIEASNGALYGAASGNSGGRLFTIQKDGSGFTWLTNGFFNEQSTALIQASDGALYGIATYAGESDATISSLLYTLKTDGSGFSTLQNIRYQIGTALAEGPDGLLYGTLYTLGTSQQPTDGYGHWFSVNKDGSNLIDNQKAGVTPVSLIKASDGALYGTTDGTIQGPTYPNPPASNPGTVFQLALGSQPPPSPPPPPTFSPAPGGYTSPLSVTLNDTAPGATIYYTTDGSTPTTSSPVYSAPIVLQTGNTTVSALASNSAGSSSVSSGFYSVAPPPTPAAPAFSPAPGSYTGSVTVTISDSTNGATIYYTTDGSTPTTSSAVYSGPIALSATTTLSAVAANSGGSSSVTSGVYTVNQSGSGGSGTVLGDSSQGFSGTQGQNGWSYGDYPTGDSTTFEAATTFGNGVWTGAYDNLSISATTQDPAIGTNDLDIVSAVRRWTSSYSGTVHVVGSFQQSRQGDGVGVRVLVNGQVVVGRTLIGVSGDSDTLSFDFDVAVTSGSTIDFAVDPGPGRDTSYDNPTVVATITVQ